MGAADLVSQTAHRSLPSVRRNRVTAGSLAAPESWTCCVLQTGDVIREDAENCFQQCDPMVSPESALPRQKRSLFLF